MYHSVYPIFVKHTAHLVKIGYVGLDETVVRSVLDVFEIGKISCVGQLVEVDYQIVGIFVDKSLHVVAYESCSTGDKNASVQASS